MPPAPAEIVPFPAQPVRRWGRRSPGDTRRAPRWFPRCLPLLREAPGPPSAEGAASGVGSVPLRGFQGDPRGTSPPPLTPPAVGESPKQGAGRCLRAPRDGPRHGNLLPGSAASQGPGRAGEGAKTTAVPAAPRRAPGGPGPLSRAAPGAGWGAAVRDAAPRPGLAPAAPLAVPDTPPHPPICGEAAISRAAFPISRAPARERCGGGRAGAGEN